MKITGLAIDGFGVWSGLELPELSDELNVFYGPNEAGKTTLMQFVRSVLYGFSPERRTRYLPPVRPGRPGGTVYLLAGQKRYAISRHADESGESGEAALVSDGLEAVHDERALAGLMGQVDEPTFNNVFAFGLREIQELGTLSDTQAADELYDLALGLDRVSLLDVLGELEASRNRLLAPDDRPSLVAQLLSQRERLRGEVDELSQGTARYLSLSAERDKLADEIARLEGEVARFERQGRELALARALGDRWQRRSAIDARLSGLAGFEALPEGALAQFDRLESRLAARRRRHARLSERRRALGAQVEQLNINEPLCRQAPRLEALGEQQDWIASLERQVTDLAAELLQLEALREESVKKFGASSTGIGAAVTSQRGLAELRTAGKSLRKARRELRALKAQLSDATAAAAEHQGKIAAALDGNPAADLTRALADAGELVSQLRKRVQIDQRLDQMSRRETELEEQSHDHLEKQILPTWALVGVGGLFVLGCALVLLFLAGQVLPVSLSRSLGWPVGLVGVLASAAAVLTKFTLEHSASRQLDNCHSQIHLLGQQIQQAKDQRDELDGRLPRGGGPLVSRLQTAEATLARLEQLLPLEAQREAAQRNADALRGQAQALGARYAALKKPWRQLLSDHGLPPDLNPSQLGEYARRRDELRGLVGEIDEKNKELTRRRAECDALSARIGQLVRETGIVPRGARPLDQLRECLAEWGQQQSRLKERDELERQIALVRRRQKGIRRQAAKVRGRRQHLLRTAGGDVSEFRRLAQAQAEAQRLRAERVQLAHEIDAALAGQTSEQQLAEWLAAPQNLEHLEAHVADARRIAADHVSQALERRGEMNQQLKMLVEDRRLAHKRIELGIVEKRLQDALERWRVVTTCGMMLEAVRQYYEREHQPPALREASGYLQRLTAGRYTRVWTPLGEHALVVDDNQGRSLKVELLSRGTREQLFLALRLALVSSYARRGVRLPLVLDDVLVNFDLGRAKAAALVLRDFARAGHQLLVFTCHEHISKLFKNIKAEVRQLPDNGQLPTTANEPAPRRPRRGKSEVLAETEAEDEPASEPETSELEPPITTSPLPPVSPATPRMPPRVERAPVERPAIERPVVETPRAKAPVQRVEWSAEEFEGELSDRVRRPSRADRESASASDASDEEDDAEAA